MTNDQVAELAREFLGELMCSGVEEFTLQRMIRRAIQPIPYLNVDPLGKIEWDDKGLEIDPIDTPLRTFEMRELMNQNSHRCTSCHTVFETNPEGGYKRVAARVFRDDVRTGALCNRCFGEYLVSRPDKAAAALPQKPQLG